MEDKVEVGNIGHMKKMMGEEWVRNGVSEGQVGQSRNTYIIKLIKKMYWHGYNSLFNWVRDQTRNKYIS